MCHAWSSDKQEGTNASHLLLPSLHLLESTFSTSCTERISQLQVELSAVFPSFEDYVWRSSWFLEIGSARFRESIFPYWAHDDHLSALCSIFEQSHHNRQVHNRQVRNTHGLPQAPLGAVSSLLPKEGKYTSLLMSGAFITLAKKRLKIHWSRNNGG